LFRPLALRGCVSGVVFCAGGRSGAIFGRELQHFEQFGDNRVGESGGSPLKKKVPGIVYGSANVHCKRNNSLFSADHRGVYENGYILSYLDESLIFVVFFWLGAIVLVLLIVVGVI